MFLLSTITSMAKGGWGGWMAFELCQEAASVSHFGLVEKTEPER